MEFKNNLDNFKHSISKMYIEISLQERETRIKNFKDGFIELEGKKMSFRLKYFGQKPSRGYTLVIGLHGGGGCAKTVNDQQWNNHNQIYQFPNGIIWFTPRAPEDAWNMWHLPYIDKMLDYMIQSFIICEMIDPNKVILSGYSAGGDGVYKLAPRMADRLMGAVMCAGHPNGTSILSLRNISFSLQVGEHDSAYDRNKVAIQYQHLFQVQKSKDFEGYDNFVKLQSDCQHWMKKRDYEAFEWLFPKTRTVFPNKIVWKQCNDVPKNSFYWLTIPDNELKKGSLIMAELISNSIYITSDDIKTIGIRINDNMLDMDHPIKIFFNGVHVLDEIIPRSTGIAINTIMERFDPFLIYYGEVFIKAPLQ